MAIDAYDILTGIPRHLAIFCTFNCSRASRNQSMTLEFTLHYSIMIVPLITPKFAQKALKSYRGFFQHLFQDSSRNSTRNSSKDIFEIIQDCLRNSSCCSVKRCYKDLLGILYSSFQNSFRQL